VSEQWLGEQLRWARTSDMRKFSLSAICLTFLAVGGVGPGPTVAQVGPAADTPVPRQFQESYKVYLDMRSNAVAPKELPDWSGLWTRKTGPAGLVFDSNQPLPISAGHITAELTPQYQAMFEKKLRDVAAGREWDPLSDCLPSGFPRWLTEPFLREAVVTRKETWWIQEQQNEIRRIYTDGRGHVPEDEAYSLWDGDSIGFWDKHTLVIHTIRVKPGQYNRSQPDYSDQTSTVERVRLKDKDTMEDDVTVWDPLSLKKPWRVLIYWTKVTTPGLRIDTWSCEENSNVAKTPDGGTRIILPGEPGYRDPEKLQESPPAPH
jgi:hypothetical protein